MLVGDFTGLLPIHSSIESKDIETFKFLLNETDKARRLKHIGAGEFLLSIDLRGG